MKKIIARTILAAASIPTRYLSCEFYTCNHMGHGERMILICPHCDGDVECTPHETVMVKCLNCNTQLQMRTIIDEEQESFFLSLAFAPI